MKKTDKLTKINFRSYLVINTIAYLGITVHLVLIPVFYFIGFAQLAFLNIFSAILWFTGWRVNRLGYYDLAIVLMISEVILHTIFVVPVIGWHAGFQYYLLGAIPFSLFNNRFNELTIILISILLCSTFAVLNAVTHDKPQPLTISDSLIQIINYANIMISFTAVAMISYYFRLASVTLEQELEKLASTDSLTGLYNRRRMLEMLEAQRLVSSRTGSDFTMIFVDIDHFKTINDTYGHCYGDYILCEMASFMKNHLRHNDVLARWGGEEFLILLPDTDIHGARNMAEKIRKTIAAKRFHLDGREFSVTMTFGLSQHEAHASIDDSLKNADNALYKGKEAGRNLVMG